jgi:hypothetical protein
MSDSHFPHSGLSQSRVRSRSAWRVAIGDGDGRTCVFRFQVIGFHEHPPQKSIPVHSSESAIVQPLPRWQCHIVLRSEFLSEELPRELRGVTRSGWPGIFERQRTLRGLLTVFTWFSRLSLADWASTLVVPTLRSLQNVNESSATDFELLLKDHVRDHQMGDLSSLVISFLS